MTIVVYLGPTMSWSQAREILPDAVYLPPAAQSDIISAVEELRPTGILLIDGVFTQQLSVWHKEILYALEQGVAVYGSSSMGALRMAETAAYGARGFGQVFEDFMSGALTDDDEVAVMHAGAEWEYRAISDAMVNIRRTLRRAAEDGVVTESQHDVLIDLAKRRFYPERSYATLLSDAREHGLAISVLEKLREFLRSHAVDQKREDAAQLLVHVAEHGVDPPDPVWVTRSHTFRAVYHRDRRVRRHGTSLPLADIAAHAALHLPDFAEVNEQALHAGLVDVLGELLKVDPEPEAITAELLRFRADRRLRTDEDVEAWRRDNDLNQEDFDLLIRQQATRRALRDWYISRKYLERTTQEVLDELRVRGRYPAVADAAGDQQSMLDAAHPDFTSSVEETDLLDLIRGQARDTGWRPTVSLDVWAFENGFKDVYDVRFELVRAKLARAASHQALAALLTSPAADGT
jgi:hypothetical protein